ncbi:MlaD family protein [Actinomadura bangladeshensis]|uniref:MCE family protein n=1 Tax=Actinomadura bangladeshensis TaxID=453573 RepID=A0A4R4NKW0_9ACTN|nr:MlaD family protein [Actinomadura bangladeshensis]TDC09799.1 MCE family protein [Actinomadura bangladeshensis]
MRAFLTCVLVGVLAVAAGGCSLQTIGAPRGDVTLNATFDDVQSLVIGHSVQVADIRVGTVTGIALDGYRARVTMSLRKRVPTGTTATIAKSSLLGENYVRLELPAGARLDTGPFLASGATIANTSVQPDLEQISEKVGPLLAALGGQDIATISAESATALDGKGHRLNTLIARAADVGDQYAAASTDLGRALDSLGWLGRSLSKGSKEIDRLPGSVELATRRLQDDRDNLKRTIQALLKLATSVNAKVQQRHAKRLGVLLERADELLAAALRGRDELKALAGTVLDFLNGPSVSSSGQALLFLWIKGFLPHPNAAAAGSSSKRTDLRGLLGPRP